MTQLKAPNGKPSNLTPEQWKLVRTPQFKAFFGDWENDPENASKVVDENGEPLVVYHGTSGDLFYEFMPFAVEYIDGKAIKEFRGNRTKEEFDEYIKSYGLRKIEPKFWFSTKKSYGKNHLECFLDIKNIMVGEDIFIQNKQLPIDVSGVTIKEEDEDYFFVLNSTQIKLADGSNTTFDGNNPDIRFAEGGLIEKNIDNKLKDIGFELNAQYRYGKKINNQDYITAFYSKKDKLYKIRGVHKFKTPLGENSVGIQFNFDNEQDFYNKIYEYLGQSDIRFAEGGSLPNYLHILIEDINPEKKYFGQYKKIFDIIEEDITLYNPYGTEDEKIIGNDFHIWISPIPDNDKVEQIKKLKGVKVLSNYYAEGGKTKRYIKKIKRGGITYGKSHAEGGIPVKNQSTGDMLEVEGGEGIVNKRSMASKSKVKLNGKDLTICQAVSELNQMEGGVQFSCEDVSDRQFIRAMAKGGELDRGTKTEQEHIQVLKDLYAKRITPKQASKRIAKDHSKEDSQYYSKLAKMEGKMADGGKTRKHAKTTLKEAVGFDINSIDISKL